MIVWFLLLIIFFLVMSTEYYGWRTGVPTVASFRPVREKMLQVLQKHHAAYQGSTRYTIIDLGSGNGQLASKIACALPDTKVIGIEISIVPWMLSKIRQALFGPGNLTFRRVDFWAYDCSKLDAVVVFLTPNLLERMSQKLKKELKPGAQVVMNECPLPGEWEPLEVIDTGVLKVQVFVYKQK